MAGAAEPALDAAPDAERCPSCGAHRPGRFCPDCGERRVERQDFSLRSFAVGLVGDLTSFDHAVLRTGRALFRHPGALAEAYFAGRRGTYVRPVQLFLLLSVAVFLILPHTGMLQFGLDGYLEQGAFRDEAARLMAEQMARRSLSREAYLARFGEAIWTQKKTLLLAVVPLFALVTFVLEHARPGSPRRRYYVEHLVYAVHFYAYLLLFLLAYLAVGITLVGVSRVLPFLRPLVHWAFNSSTGANVLLASGLLLYLVAGTRRFFGRSLGASAALALVQGYAFGWLLFMAYPTLCIFATFLAM